jgi:hypothetical protein
MHHLTNLLLPLVIIDFITTILYIKKRSPPWIVFFISLFAVPDGRVRGKRLTLDRLPLSPNGACRHVV